MWPADSWDSEKPVNNISSTTITYMQISVGITSLGATVLTDVPPGTFGIFLDNLGCTGTESRLIQCPHNGVNVHNCQHFEDVGVRCLASLTSTSTNVVLINLIPNISVHIQIVLMETSG